MTAKKYLQQIGAYEMRVAQRIEQVNHMREQINIISGIDYSKDRVQSSPHSGNKQIESLVDMENGIAKMIVKEERLRDKIIGEIQQLTNPIHVDILYRRYVQLHSFERIANDIYLSYYRVIHLHGEALQAFQKIMEDNSK